MVLTLESPAGFDFTDPDIRAERLPVDELAQMRRPAPIRWSPCAATSSPARRRRRCPRLRGRHLPILLAVASNEVTRNSITEDMMAFTKFRDQ
ncbi:hypothetical protein [Mycobacterium sp. 155]|uniref:hypothetical protein n=1 Tax=Mycobacterium sp. 155 TaxID=1157943 RepID=UPI000378A9DD|nr:hypothetical protein [Mycobacterium sp. 155]